MGRSLVLWEVDPNRMPVDFKERAAALQAFMGIIGKAKEDGIIKEWGAFAGELNGFGVYEGTETEVPGGLHQFIPFSRNRVYAFVTADEAQEWTASVLR